VLQQLGPKGSENGYPTEDLGVRAIGREGLALGPAWEDLEELHIEGLSSQGVSRRSSHCSSPQAWTIGSHLELLADLHDSHQPPRLHTLSLSTHFLDLRLCRAVAKFGSLRSLKHLTLSTTGTKFSAECLNHLLSGCSVLESLKLTDIEGELSPAREAHTRSPR
jgi:hypothetical protein